MSPLNTLTMYSLPTLSSSYQKLKKTRMKRLPTRSLAYWGILAVEAANKNQEDCPEDGIHLQKMAFTYKDLHEMLLLPYMGIMLQYTFQQGQPPSIPQYTS